MRKSEDLSKVSYPYYDRTFSIVGQEIIDNFELRQRLKGVVSDKKIADLGCNTELRYCIGFLNLGAKAYTGIDPHYSLDVELIRSLYRIAQEKEITYCRTDAVTWLKENQSEREIVTFSSGLLESSIIFNHNYAKSVVSGIRTLTRPEPSAIHVVDGYFEKLMRNSGLHLDWGTKLSNGLVLGIFSQE